MTLLYTICIVVLRVLRVFLSVLYFTLHYLYHGFARVSLLRVPRFCACLFACVLALRVLQFCACLGFARVPVFRKHSGVRVSSGGLGIDQLARG